MRQKKKRSYFPLFCAASAAVFFASLPFFSPEPMTLSSWPYFVGAGLCAWAAWMVGRRIK